jgi:hypothetical protein
LALGVTVGGRKPYRSVSKSDPEFGPVCGCGRRKSKQAFTCQACHNVIRGYGTVPLRENRIVGGG